MSDNLEINIAKDFSSRLGARYKYEGKFSGELFLESLLEPKFLDAFNKKVKLLVYLDGVLGYPSSFVSGSFGKLSDKHGYDKVLSVIDLISDNQIRREKILFEIKFPRKK